MNCLLIANKQSEWVKFDTSASACVGCSNIEMFTCSFIANVRGGISHCCHILKCITCNCLFQPHYCPLVKFTKVHFLLYIPMMLRNADKPKWTMTQFLGNWTLFYYYVNIHVQEWTVARQQLLWEKTVWSWEDRHCTWRRKMHPILQ